MRVVGGRWEGAVAALAEDHSIYWLHFAAETEPISSL